MNSLYSGHSVIKIISIVNIRIQFDDGEDGCTVVAYRHDYETQTFPLKKCKNAKEAMKYLCWINGGKTPAEQTINEGHAKEEIADLERRKHR